MCVCVYLTYYSANIPVLACICYIYTLAYTLFNLLFITLYTLSPLYRLFGGDLNNSGHALSRSPLLPPQRKGRTSRHEEGEI